MNPPAAFRLLAPVLLTVAPCAGWAAQGTDAAKPNIVLIVSDDQGYADLGILGGNGIITPNLDRLCREGTRLTSFYVSWPACTPSRGSLLTGRYPQRNGTYDMYRNEAPDYGHRYEPEDYRYTFERVAGMDTREILIPALLADSGYVSGIFGKWDLGVHRRFLPLARGFDAFYGLVNTGIDYYTHERYGVPSMYDGNEPTTRDKGTYATTLFRDKALEFLHQHTNDPFFLYLPFNAPHNSSSLDPVIRTSVQAPPEYKDLYPDPGPETVTRPRFGKYPATGEDIEVTSRAARVRDYRAAVTCMDAAIGSVLDFLDHEGLAENTLVIFLSDNGGGGGADNGPLRGGKSKMFEGGIRVPCILRWPGRIPAGQVSDAFLTALEIFPTLMAATGTEVPDGLVLDGFDMLPVLQGEMSSPRERMFWKRRGDEAARLGHWKWVRSKAGNGLFDLSEDLGEKNDLSEARPEMAARLEEAFQAWLREMEQAEPRGPFRDF